MAVFLAPDELRMVTGQVYPVEIDNDRLLTRSTGDLMNNELVRTLSIGRTCRSSATRCCDSAG